MSKDKGSKNHKKAKATGKDKVVSVYKSEGKKGVSKENTLNVFSPKPAPKGDENSKSK